MKIKVNLKTILVVLTIVTLFVVPTYVFAAEDITDFWGDSNTGWEDLTKEDEKDGAGSEGTGTEGKENTETGKDKGTETQGDGTTNTGNGSNANNNDDKGTNKNQNNNKKPESYDKAGIAEDTMMVVAVIALIMIAICAYNKVNEYKGI